MAVRAQQMKIVGYPVCIEDDKYHRNALLFNIGTVHDRAALQCTKFLTTYTCVRLFRAGFVFNDHVETAPYRPIIRKVNRSFISKY